MDGEYSVICHYEVLWINGTFMDMRYTYEELWKSWVYKNKKCPLEVRIIFSVNRSKGPPCAAGGKRCPLRVRNRNTTLVATDRIIYNQKPPSCFFPTARGCPFPCTIICLPLCNKAVYLLSCTRPHLFRLCVQYFGQALNIPEKAYDFRAFLGQHGLDHIIRFRGVTRWISASIKRMISCRL